MKKLLEEIAYAIYFKNFSKYQQNKISSIIYSDVEEMQKANLICDLLQIEKRGNRQNIYMVLVKYTNDMKFNKLKKEIDKEK